MQVNMITNIGAVLFAGLGGALVPQSLLPHWAQTVAPLAPSYWAMLGYKHVILGMHGGVLRPALVLLGFAAVFMRIAAVRLHPDESKLV